MNPIKTKHWCILIILTITSLCVWHKFTYPTLTFVDFSIDRKEALQIAQHELSLVDPQSKDFLSAIQFKRESAADKYLQMNLGFDGLLNFVKEHDFDMFLWEVRFFQEEQKEEYRFGISSSKGEVIFYQHTLEETTATKDIPKEILFSKSIKFLQEKFDFNIQNYTPNIDFDRTLPNREEYIFSWDKNNVKIPWSKEEGTNVAYLSSKIHISGDQVLGFTKNMLRIPEDYEDAMKAKKNIGKTLLSMMRIFNFLLLITSIYYVASRTHHLAPHATKSFYIRLAIFTLFLTIIDIANGFQNILMHYDTTSSLRAFLYQDSGSELIHLLIMSLTLIIPAVAGESLRFETRKEAKTASLFYYLSSSFFTRHVAALIILGYLVAAIMFGLQSSLFEFGRHYLGVWQEQTWRSQFTSSYLPFLTAFALSLKSSLAEEFLYRLFAIHLGIKLFKNIPMAVVVSGLIWGFAHSSYPIYPMWFRGLEMTIIGLFMGTMYIRFGLIPVIVGHFIFNSGWHTLNYILGNSTPFYYYSSFAVLLVPLLWALLAFILNRSEHERPLTWKFSPAQKFNITVLETYLKFNSAKYDKIKADDLKIKIATKGWDFAVVDKAVDNYLASLNTSK